MSSKKKKEEEYKSDDDEDFVPDAEDIEDQGEVYMDENEEEVALPQARQTKKKGKRKGELSSRAVRKGPFDSDDDLSESKSIPSDDESMEPAAKKAKLEEPNDSSVIQKPKVSSREVDDFYAQMMRGAPPKSKTPPSAPIVTSIAPSPSEPVKTSIVPSSSTATDPSDPMAFFAMMKKGPSSSKPSSGSTSSSGSKLAMPSSWLQPKSTDTTSYTDTEVVRSLETGPQKISVKQRYEFAGEKIEVEHMVDAKEAADIKAMQPASGLGSLLDQLKGKNKITTLQKSKLDWNQFTDQEGLEDELSQNRKDGYIKKREFLDKAAAAENATYQEGKARARR